VKHHSNQYIFNNNNNNNNTVSISFLCGISPTNVYVFAQPHSDNCLRSHDCLRINAQICMAQKPELVTSTRLRKHVATMSQIMNLKKNELDMLASFMGHDLFVHRNYYRLSQDSLETANGWYWCQYDANIFILIIFNIYSNYVL